MNKEQKTLYAQWILDDCISPVEEIEWLVNCILNNKGKKAFIHDIQWVLERLEHKRQEDERI